MAPLRSIMASPATQVLTSKATFSLLSYSVRTLALCTFSTTVKQYWVQFEPTSSHEASATLLQTSLFKVFQSSKIWYSLYLFTLL